MYGNVLICAFTSVYYMSADAFQPVVISIEIFVMKALSESIM